MTQYYQLPRWRQSQFNTAVFKNLVGSIDEILTLPKDMRSTIAKELRFPSIEAVERVTTPDGAMKTLYTCADGKRFEGVLLVHSDDRRTLCLSTQIGCPMACTFCATGQLGFTRNLRSHEIVDQVLDAARFVKEKSEHLTNIVFMGMGEPMLNIDNVMEATAILMDSEQFGMGARHLTMSTVGIIEPMKRYFNEFPQVNLALSLHSAVQKKRVGIMPKASKVSLKELAEYLTWHTETTHRRVSLEYTLIKGVNDGEDDCNSLISWVNSFDENVRKLIHVNLIQFNETPSISYEASSVSKIESWTTSLHRATIPATIRKSLGQSNFAACGQLAGEGNLPGRLRI